MLILPPVDLPMSGECGTQHRGARRVCFYGAGMK